MSFEFWYDKQGNSFYALRRILNPRQDQMHNIFANVLIATRNKHFLAFNFINSICLRNGFSGQIAQRGTYIRLCHGHGASKAATQHMR